MVSEINSRANADARAFRNHVAVVGSPIGCHSWWQGRRLELLLTIASAGNALKRQEMLLWRSAMMMKIGHGRQGLPDISLGQPGYFSSGIGPLDCLASRSESGSPA